MPSVSDWFENFLQKIDGRRQVITVIGTGGKTSLIWRLAAYFGGTPAPERAVGPIRKILVTPTTKMLVPSPDTGFYERYYGLGGLPPVTAPGVTLAGNFNKTSGKLESFPLDKLKSMIKGYDHVLIEGDGSQGLPFKAWDKDEPVVPAFTNLTVGILPLKDLGKPVSEKLVHRMQLFISLTGASKGELIKQEHVLRLITGRASRAGGGNLPGLFSRARGKKILFFNQVEDKASLNHARELVKNLPGDFRKELSGIIAGSIREDRVVELPLN